MSAALPAWVGKAAVFFSIALAAVMAVSQLSYPRLMVASERYLEDLWVVSDSIWRIQAGQRPNIDFVSPIGPLFYAVYGLLLKVEPASLLVIVHANLVVGTMCAAATIGVAARAVRIEVLALAALFAFLTAASGRDFGSTYAGEATSYLAPYNRWAWAFSIPAMFGLLLPPRPRGHLSYILAGACGAALFFLKLTYFAVFVAALVISFAIDAYSSASRPGAAGKALTIGAGMLAALVAGVLLFGGTSAYLADVAMVAGTNAPRYNKVIDMAPEAITFLGFGVLIYFMSRQCHDRFNLTDLARVTVMIGAGGGILLQNHDSVEAPLYYAALMLAYALGGASGDQRGEPRGRPTPAFAFALLALLLLVPIGADVGKSALLRARAFGEAPWSPIASFAGTPVEDFRSTSLLAADGSFDNEDIKASHCSSHHCQTLFETVDGLELLRRIGPADGAILPLAFSNPFSLLTRTPPPRGSLIWWHYGRSFSEGHAPPASSVFRDVGTVLVPKWEPNGEALRRIYRTTLARDFVKVRESEHWVALRRKNVPEAAGPSAASGNPAEAAIERS